MSSAELQALLDGPAALAPPGSVSQLDNPPNHQTVTIAVPAICLIFATLALAMRLYTRIFVIRQVNIADYSILIAWGIFVPYIAMAYLGGSHGPGVHMWNVRVRDLGPFLYYFHCAGVMYGVCIFFIKLSILSQYTQIFMPTKEPRTIYWATIFLIVANFIFYAVSTGLEIWACSPIDKVWNPLITAGHCIDTLALNVAASSVNTASDFTILILPQLIIWRLKISFQTRFGISLIFLIAAFACVSSAVRLFYAVKLQYHSDDATWFSWLAGLWTLPELAAGIVVACLPVAKGFVRRMGEVTIFSGISTSLRNLTTWTKPADEQNTESLALDGGRRSSSLQSGTGSFGHPSTSRPPALGSTTTMRETNDEYEHSIDSRAYHYAIAKSSSNIEMNTIPH